MFHVKLTIGHVDDRSSVVGHLFKSGAAVLVHLASQCAVGTDGVDWGTKGLHEFKTAPAPTIGT